MTIWRSGKGDSERESVCVCESVCVREFVCERVECQSVYWLPGHVIWITSNAMYLGYLLSSVPSTIECGILGRSTRCTLARWTDLLPPWSCLQMDSTSPQPLENPSTFGMLKRMIYSLRRDNFFYLVAVSLPSGDKCLIVVFVLFVGTR